MNDQVNNSPFDENGYFSDEAADQIFETIYDAYLVIRDNFSEEQQTLADQFFDISSEISYIQEDYNSEEWESTDDIDNEEKCSVLAFFSDCHPEYYIVKALVSEDFKICLQWFSPRDEENQDFVNES